jgi:serine protease
MKLFGRILAAGLLTTSLVALAEPANATPISWGLDRLDQPALPGDAKFNSSFTGLGVTAYVLDSGVNINDAGFGGRASGDLDCNGHGTHVAGTIGSSEFGVAKQVKIVSIKVTQKCSGTVTVADLAAGMQKVLKQHPAGTPGIVNISIAVGKTSTIDSLVNKLYAAGLLTVVAASNTMTDACKWSPSGAKNAVTVASANMNDYRTNNSAFGDCVDLFAPGGLISSESLQEPNGHKVMSGTSMAAPHVAGVAALYLQKNPSARPVQVIGAIRDGAIKDAVVNAQSANGNLLLNTTFLEAGLEPVAPVVPTPSVSSAPSSSPSPTASPTATASPIATPTPTPTMSTAPFVATQVPSRVNRLFASKDPAGYKLQWDAVGNLTKAGPVTYKLEASTDNKNWRVVASGSTETFAVTPIFKFFRVSAVGALGAGPLSSTVMIGLR